MSKSPRPDFHHEDEGSENGIAPRDTDLRDPQQQQDAIDEHYEQVKLLQSGQEGTTSVCLRRADGEDIDEDISDAELQRLRDMLVVVKAPSSRTKLQREFEILRRRDIDGCPYIPSLLESDGQDLSTAPAPSLPQFTFASTIVHGQTLERVLSLAEKNEVFETGMHESFVWHIGVQLLERVKLLRTDLYDHDDVHPPVMHYDIREDNIILTGSSPLPDVHLIDFGTAKIGPLRGQTDRAAYNFYNGDPHFKINGQSIQDEGVDYDIHMIVQILHKLAHMPLSKYNLKTSRYKLFPPDQPPSEDEDASENCNPYSCGCMLDIRPAHGPFGRDDTFFWECMRAMSWKWKRPAVPTAGVAGQNNRDGWMAWTGEKLDKLIADMTTRRVYSMLKARAGLVATTWNKELVSLDELRRALVEGEFIEAGHSTSYEDDDEDDSEIDGRGIVIADEAVEARGYWAQMQARRRVENELFSQQLFQRNAQFQAQRTQAQHYSRLNCTNQGLWVSQTSLATQSSQTTQVSQAPRALRAPQSPLAPQAPPAPPALRVTQATQPPQVPHPHKPPPQQGRRPRWQVELEWLKDNDPASNALTAAPNSRAAAPGFSGKRTRRSMRA